MRRRISWTIKSLKFCRCPAPRSRIGRGQYLTPSEHNPVGLLEEALLQVMACDPIHQRICKELGKNLPFTRLDELAHNALAKGLINQEEAAILTRAEHSRAQHQRRRLCARGAGDKAGKAAGKSSAKLKPHNKTITTSHAGREFSRLFFDPLLRGFCQ